MTVSEAFAKALYWFQCQPNRDWYVVEYKKGKFDAVASEHVQINFKFIHLAHAAA